MDNTQNQPETGTIQQIADNLATQDELQPTGDAPMQAENSVEDQTPPMFANAQAYADFQAALKAAIPTYLEGHTFEDETKKAAMIEDLEVEFLKKWMNENPDKLAGNSVTDLAKQATQQSPVQPQVVMFVDQPAYDTFQAALLAHMTTFSETHTFENAEDEAEATDAEQKNFLASYLEANPDSIMKQPTQPKSHQGEVIASFRVDVGPTRVVVEAILNDKVRKQFNNENLYVFICGVEGSHRVGTANPYVMLLDIPKGENPDEVHKALITNMTQTFAHTLAQTIRGLPINVFNPKNTNIWHQWCAGLIHTDGSNIKQLFENGTPLQSFGSLSSPDILYTKLQAPAMTILITNVPYVLNMDNVGGTAYLYNQFNIQFDILGVKYAHAILAPTFGDVMTITRKISARVQFAIQEAAGSEDYAVISGKLSSGPELLQAVQAQLDDIFAAAVMTLNGEEQSEGQRFRIGHPTVLDPSFNQLSESKDISKEALDKLMKSAAETASIATLDEDQSKAMLETAGLGEAANADVMEQQLSASAEVDLTDEQAIENNHPNNDGSFVQDIPALESPSQDGGEVLHAPV